METLIPNHFLLGRSNPNVTILRTQDNVSNFSTKLKFIQDMLPVFWKRWTTEYLSLLTQRKRWKMKNRNFHVGDLVVVADKNLLRAGWPLGKIQPTANLCLLKGVDWMIL